MNTTFHLDPNAPCTKTQGADDFNIRLILEAEAGEKPYLSTSQEIMVGLALCKPGMLKNAGFPIPRDAWNRLNAEQRAAITNFRNFQLGGLKK